jgi:ABC-2 type transport system ATP-binding protein
LSRSQPPFRPAAGIDFGHQRVAKLLVARKRVGGFSLGMGQRLGIAAALLGDPRTVILDEPVNGLDTEGIRWIRSLLRGLAAEGRTVFVSSHDLSELEQVCDWLIVIERGAGGLDALLHLLEHDQSLETRVSLLVMNSSSAARPSTRHRMR